MSGILKSRRRQRRTKSFARALQVGRGFVMWKAKMIEKDLGGDRYFEILEGCSLLRSYKEAFQAATGLPLILLHKACDRTAQEASAHKNPFCRILSEGGSCKACGVTLASLRRGAGSTAHTTECFARLKETVVPVMHAGQPVAYLKTGEVLVEQPDPEDFMHIAAVLLSEGRSGPEIKRLREAYFQAPVMDEARYQGMVFLLESFGRQLSEMLAELVVSKSQEVPMPVRKAIHFIENNLDESLSLEDVSIHSGLSISQFCKVFKEHTSSTFTEYVNRRRIEWARRELLRPRARVTEVAYRVGYTSLSQFNRCFHRFMGESPRDYRRRRLLEVV